MNETRGLWRGKRINNKEHNGEWVEGFLYPVKYTGFDFSRGTDYYIDTYPSGAGRLHTQVDPSTLGECTGLTDKNGKLIFEGDILHVDEDLLVIVSWDETNARFIADDIFDDFLVMDIQNLCYCKIIGNIHDNPELLGGRENETD